MQTKLALALFWALAVTTPMALSATPPSHAESESPPNVAPEVVRSDLALLYQTLQEAHFDLYVHRSKAKYDRLYQKLRGTIRTPMTSVAVATMFQKFVAYGKIGHARIDSPVVAFVAYLQGGGTLIPLFIRVDGKRVLLTEPAEGSGQLRAGTEITAIDGKPVHEVIDRLGRYISAERPYMIYAQMEQSFPALLWLDRGKVSSVEATAIVAGQPLTISVPALTLAQRRALATKYPTGSLATNFSTREYRPLGNGIAYLRPGPFFNIEQPEADSAPSYQAAPFMAFIDDSFQKILATGATDLILDLRDNPGGDNSFSDPMIAWFATRPFRFASSFTLKASAATKADYARLRAAGSQIDPAFASQMEAEAREPNGARYKYDLPLVQPRKEPRFRGRVWALINRHSYSNAASVAALIQDYSFGKVIGEETADVASNFASVQSFTLPGTQIVVTYPKSHFVRPNGTDDVSGVMPDIAIARAPVGAAEDLMLKEALSLIKRR
ncbi:S41 family peptidase [Sphingopyxis fribergensis]